MVRFLERCNLAAAVEVYCHAARFKSVAKTHLIRCGRSCNQEAGAGANSDSTFSGG